MTLSADWLGNVLSASTTGTPKLTSGDRSVRGPEGVRITPPTFSATASRCRRLLWPVLVGVAQKERVAGPVGDVFDTSHHVGEERPGADVGDDQGPDPVLAGAQGACHPARTVAEVLYDL